VGYSREEKQLSRKGGGTGSTPSVNLSKGQGGGFTVVGSRWVKERNSGSEGGRGRECSPILKKTITGGGKLRRKIRSRIPLERGGNGVSKKEHLWSVKIIEREGLVFRGRCSPAIR